jgi:hypothetical protein
MLDLSRIHPPVRGVRLGRALNQFLVEPDILSLSLPLFLRSPLLFQFWVGYHPVLGEASSSFVTPMAATLPALLPLMVELVIDESNLDER